MIDTASVFIAICLTGGVQSTNEVAQFGRFVLAHPRERTGTLIQAKPEAEELVGLERQSGVVRTDPSRV